MREQEPRCLDCPGRTGFSGFVGDIVTKACIKRGVASIIHERRPSNCSGAVPVPNGRSAKHSTFPFIQDGQVITNEWQDQYYRLACPKDLDQIPEVPIEVTLAMKVNRLAFFAQRIENQRIQPLEDVRERTSLELDWLEARSVQAQ